MNALKIGFCLFLIGLLCACTSQSEGEAVLQGDSVAVDILPPPSPRANELTEPQLQTLKEALEKLQACAFENDIACVFDLTNIRTIEGFSKLNEISNAKAKAYMVKEFERVQAKMDRAGIKMKEAAFSRVAETVIWDEDTLYTSAYLDVKLSWERREITEGKWHMATSYDQGKTWSFVDIQDYDETSFGNYPLDIVAQLKKD